MNSKRSAKRSPVSRDCQENKSADERYLEPAFIDELREKAVRYFIGADQSRFPKRITKDPLFQAIAYVRSWHLSEQKLAKDSSRERLTSREFLDLRKERLGPKDHDHEKLLARAFITAVRQGNIGRLNDIVELCRIFDSKAGCKPKRDLPWEYYAAKAALGFLTQGTVPLKKELKKAALKERAIAELPVMYRIGSKELLQKMQEAGEPREMRIDPLPVPKQGPENYYEPNLGHPEDPWHAQQQLDGQLQLPTKSQAAKPALARQQQIDERIEELRALHTPKVWAATWWRIFSNLGLDRLPRC
jgi:hypothetical protein